jgi:DNA-binding transcriptional LysR family regulator
MISELRTFVTVARLGTFAAAGETVGLTQSAVSGQMKRLEDKLGHALFERTGRSAQLNETGLRVFEKALNLLSLADTLAEPVTPQAQEGTLKIGAIASSHINPVRHVLFKFAAEFPNMCQSVLPGTSLDLLDKVDSQHLDLAIIIRPNFKPPSSLKWTKLLDEPFVLIAPRSWGVDDPQHALRSLPFMRYSRVSFGGRQVERYLTTHQIRPKDVVELDDIPTILSLVADGKGIAIVPKVAAYEELFAAVKVIKIDDAHFKREVGIIYSHISPEPAYRFIDLCKETKSSETLLASTGPTKSMSYGISVTSES